MFKYKEVKAFICKECGVEFNRVIYKRKDNPQFCTKRCSALYRNKVEDRGAQYRASEKMRAAAIANLKKNQTARGISGCMKKRNMHKYKDLMDLFNEREVRYEVEYVLGDYVFNIALLDYKVFVEFDVIDTHKWERNDRYDKEKDEYAKKMGWQVVRIELAPKEVPFAYEVVKIIEKKTT